MDKKSLIVIISSYSDNAFGVWIKKFIRVATRLVTCNPALFKKSPG